MVTFKVKVKEGIACKGWMLYQTDKSGKLCLDTVSNYEECMAEHVLKDPIVTPEMVKKGEEELNNHARQWARITSAGSDKGHQWRINRALVNNFTTIPPLMGLRKDHKPDLDNNPSKGPKLRPLCPANISPNSALGNLMSNIVRGLADERQEKLNSIGIMPSVVPSKG